MKHFDVSKWLGRELTAAVISGLMAFAGGSAAAAGSEVPVRFIDGLPVVAVKLGDVSVDFLVDTGGQIGLTVPQPLVGPATKVTLRDDFEKRGDAAGHVVSVQKLTATSVELGGVQLGPVDGLIHYKWGLSIGDAGAPDVTKKGVIGFKALSSKNVLFDFAHGSMVLYERGGNDRPDVTAWQKTQFDYDARGVVIKLQIKGVDAALALDTAATASMIKKDAAVFSKQKSPCVGKKVDEQFCGILSVRQAESNGGQLGRMKFAVVQMGAMPFDGLIGSDFFESRKVFVDFDSKTLYIQPIK